MLPRETLDGESSKGRTAGFEPANEGSNPSSPVAFRGTIGVARISASSRASGRQGNMVTMVQRLELRVVIPAMRVRFPLATL